MDLKAKSQDDVLIIGTGPSGLLAAVELARRGVIPRVVEHEPNPPRQARATAIQPATLEILAQAGLLNQVLLSSVHLRYARLYDADLTRTAETDFAIAGNDCPWPFQCSLPQWRTEHILTDRFTDLGGTIERGVTAVAIRDADASVRIDLNHADGTAETAEACWLIGAGGAHSVTRESMTEELVGETYPGTAVVADVAVTSSLPRDGSALIATPAGYVLLAPLPDHRWLTFIGDLADDEVDRLNAGEPSDAVAGIMARRLPSPQAEVTDVAWAAAFRMHKRMTPNLADGRRFLLGDAGHLSSPFGGEGLNSGLHDAHNLAWKLALQVQGRARPGLLGTFAVERGAAVQYVLDVSDRLHNLVRTAVASARAGTKARPPAPSAADAAALVRGRCMLDVSYAASPLTIRYPEQAGGAPAPGERYPGRSGLTGTGHHLLVSGRPGGPAVDRIRHRWAGLLDIHDQTGNGLVLVRPDGYLGFRAASADAAGLAAVDAHLDSYLIPG